MSDRGVDYYELAVVGYHAYGEDVSWTNYAGKPMPKWDELPKRLQEAWIESARAIADLALKMQRG